MARCAAWFPTLAQVGTTVGQIDEILKGEEQAHSETPVTFSNHDIAVKDVSFGYHDDKEILHDVSLSIPSGKMIAHRLKTVRHADQILVVDHGHIVQQGKHEDLINQPGIYADFVGGRKQAAGWKL